MSFPDISLPVLAFLITLFLLPSVKDGVKSIHWIIGALSLMVMGFTLWNSHSNSETNVQIRESLSSAQKDREIDSINDASFQRFMKDSFGIERQGNQAEIINHNLYDNRKTYNTINSPLISPFINNDATNYELRFSKTKDSLIIYPKNGVWIKPFISFDINKRGINEGLFQGDGMSLETTGVTEVTNIEGINYNTLTVFCSLIRDRQMPMYLDISGDKKQYIIFGDASSPEKRYLYQNGKIKWIPKK